MILKIRIDDYFARSALLDVGLLPLLHLIDEKPHILDIINFVTSYF